MVHNGMEIGAEKTKLMTKKKKKNTSGINTEIKVNGQRLETVTSFKYLGSVITRAVVNREEWRKLVAKSSVVPQRPSWLRD